MKRIPIGDFQPFIDGMFNGELPPVGRWIEVLWPDKTITTHQVEADSPESILRGVTCVAYPPKARYVHWLEEDEKHQAPGG